MYTNSDRGVTGPVLAVALIVSRKQAATKFSFPFFSTVAISMGSRSEIHADSPRTCAGARKRDLEGREVNGTVVDVDADTSLARLDFSNLAPKSAEVGVDSFEAFILSETKSLELLEGDDLKAAEDKLLWLTGVFDSNKKLLAGEESVKM